MIVHQHMNQENTYQQSLNRIFRGQRRYVSKARARKLRKRGTLVYLDQFGLHWFFKKPAKIKFLDVENLWDKHVIDVHRITENVKFKCPICELKEKQNAPNLH